MEDLKMDPNYLPPSLGAELAECVAFAFAVHLIHAWAKRWQLGETDRKNVVSAIHSMWSGFGGLLIAYSEWSRVTSQAKDPISTMRLWRQPFVNPSLTLLFHGEMGYYIWDLYIDMKDAYRRGLTLHGIGYVVHHLIPLSLLAAMAWRQRFATHETEHLVSSLLTINMSTWLLVILSAARKRGHSRRLWYRLLHLCFIGLFFTFRLYGVWWTLEQRAMRWAEWETLEGREPPASLLGKVLGCVQTKCLIGTAILTFLNLMWLGLNFKKAAEIWGLVTPRSIPAAAKKQAE